MKIQEKRINALYKYVNCSTPGQRDRVLHILLATASNKQLKEVCEELNITI